MQIGFDFSDTLTPAFTEQPAGTWLRPRFARDELAAELDRVREAVQSIAGPARPLFEQGIVVCSDWLASIRYTHDVSIPLNWFTPQPEAVAAFVRHCDTFAGSEFTSSAPTIEYKVMVEPEAKHYGMFVEGVGSLIVTTRGSYPNTTRISAEYLPYRDDFFFAGYRDNAAIIEASCAVWCDAYCADKIAFAPSGVASVPTFIANGREHIMTSIGYHGTYAIGKAWTFCRFADWHAPAYAYREHCEATDRGRIERGDYRGMIVMVRGQKCVIDGFAWTVGADLKSYTPTYSSEEDGQTDMHDPEGDDEEEDEEHCATY